MRNELALYWKYIGISLRGQMQYRASFLMTTVGMFLAIGTEFLGVALLFQRFGSLHGWRLPEVALFYGLIHTAFALAEGTARGFDTFGALIQSGDFDRLLLRPRSTAFQVAAREVQLMRIGRMMVGLFALIWAIGHLEISWTLARIALLPLIILGGACLFYGLLILQATMAFWTIDSLEIMNTVTYGGTETAQYPLTIYRPWFRRFFTFIVPLACVNYLPVNLILGRGEPVFWLWFTPLVGVLFLLVSLQLWKVGVRHYTSTGS